MPIWRMIFCLLLHFSIAFAWVHTAGARETKTPPLEVAEGGICQEIARLKCVRQGTQFSPEVGKLHCFTRMVGAVNPTVVTHVWYFENREVFRIALPVKSADWRTFSQKTIPPRKTGAWRVDVFGPQQEHLTTLSFHIIPSASHSEDTAPANLPSPSKSAHHKTTGKPIADQMTLRDAPLTDVMPAIGRDIRLDTAHQGSEKLLVSLNRYRRPRVLVLGGAIPSVAIHIGGVSYWNGKSEIPAKGKAIERIRAEWYQKAETLRILLDLNPRLHWEVKTYPESGDTYCVEILYEPVKP